MLFFILIGCKKADLTALDEISGRYECQSYENNFNQPSEFTCNWSFEIEPNGKVRYITPGTPNGLKSKMIK